MEEFIGFCKDACFYVGLRLDSLGLEVKYSNNFLKCSLAGW